jgi:adenylate cyclase
MDRDRNPLTLRFRSREREEAFARAAVADSLRTNRGSLLLALALYVGFAAADHLLSPGSVTAVWSVRAAVGATLLAAYALTGSARYGPRAAVPALVVSVLAMGSGFIAIPAVSGGDPSHYYYGALFLLILFAHGLVRMPFVYATTSCALVTIAHLGLANRMSDVSHSMLAHAFLLVAANAFGVFASHTRENAARTTYRQAQRLAKRQRAQHRAIRRMQRLGRELERSERKYHRLVDAMNEGLVTTDAGGRITWVNDSLCRMTGYTREEIIGRDPTAFLDDAGRSVFAAEFAKRTAGHAGRYAIDWVRKDGSYLSTLVSPHPFFADDGAFTSSTAVVSDITPLKEAEAALARSERHFRELVDFAHSIVLRWDADGTITFINPYGNRLLGYETEDLTGRNVIGTIVPETDSSGRNLVEMIHDISVHPERYLYNENEIRGRDGRRFWVVWTNRAIADGTGHVTEVLSIGTDITELKEARDELAELNDFLRRAFGRYVSEAVVRRLLESPDGLAVTGRRTCVTVLVADIRGFSALCETRPPEHVVALLNGYLEAMTAVIERYGGTIDEILGDGVLVIFGAPVWQEDHAERAVACAVAMQLAMGDVNAANVAANLPAIEMGIGIDTGEIVAGSIGSTRRAKYGVVGPTVNRAARIESCTVGGQILASAATLRAAGPIVATTRSMTVQPKGANEPLQLHDVTGIRGRHQLVLPGIPLDLQPLDTPLECQWAVLTDKFVGSPPARGRITAVSDRGAEMAVDATLAPLADLRLALLDAEGRPIPTAAYAKVIEQVADEPHRVIVRFTALPETMRTRIHDVVRSSSAAEAVPV